jgi:hypothetical protein
MTSRGSNNNHSTISDRNRISDGDNNVDNPARDFLPPRSHVRKRQPTSTESLSLSSSYLTSREVEEGLAYKAARDQLSGNKQWKRGDAAERKVRKTMSVICYRTSDSFLCRMLS